MKYFTTDWWANGGDDLTAFTQYEAYLASARAHLPPALSLLESQYTLHDSKVSLICNNFERKTVDLQLRGWDRALLHRVNYTLKFLDVKEFVQTLSSESAEELGDLGYWECEYLAPLVEMRMLFASSAEFRIVFGGFAFTHETPNA